MADTTISATKNVKVASATSTEDTGTTDNATGDVKHAQNAQDVQNAQGAQVPRGETHSEYRARRENVPYQLYSLTRGMSPTGGWGVRTIFSALVFSLIYVSLLDA